MVIAAIVFAHGGGCWTCGVVTSILLLCVLLAVLVIPVGIIWLVIDFLRHGRHGKAPDG